MRHNGQIELPSSLLFSPASPRVNFWFGPGIPSGREDSWRVKNGVASLRFPVIGKTWFDSKLRCLPGIWFCAQSVGGRYTGYAELLVISYVGTVVVT